MKKYILIASCVGCLSLSGCVDLLQEPQSFLTPENVVYDKKTIETFANGLYHDLWYNNYAFNCRSQILGIGADDIVTGSFAKRYVFIDELSVTSGQHDSDVEIMWQNMYSVIRSANSMIKYVAASSEETTEVKNPYLGEAYFMRAYAYFTLVRYFGEVPGFTDPECSEDIYGNKNKNIVRASIEDIYMKLIVPDLKEAENLLPNKARTSDNSAASKMAAKACLSDVYLTMAGWPLKKTEYYALARDKAAEIINENPNGYKLVDHYQDLWKEATKSSIEEHIFALNHSALNKTASNYGKSYYALEENSSAWSDYLADSCFYERYSNDERKTFNFVAKFDIPGSPRKLDYKKTQMRSPAIAKYRDFGTVASPQSDGITPIYRYAEILLIYAEAQNKAENGPNTLAYKCLNDVRQRAMGGGAYVVAKDMDKETFDKAVFDERGWEFFSEFKRWFQLIRTEKVVDANMFNPRVAEAIRVMGIATKDKATYYLMPIPQKEIENCGFEQNPR